MSNILDLKTLFQKHCTCNMYTLLMLDHVQVDLDISFSGQYMHVQLHQSFPLKYSIRT